VVHSSLIGSFLVPAITSIQKSPGILGCMSVPIYVVDAFTSRPFAGNPAAVCLLSEPAGPEWMQRVAAEMKHAETAFLVKSDDGYDLRWFTPSTEVDLCGHATLASAHILWETGKLDIHDPALFHTKSGLLTCTRHGYGIQMDFPAEPAGPVECEVRRCFGLRSAPIFVGQNRMDLLVEIESEAAVRELAPDLPAIAELGTRGVIVTARSDRPEYDFVSRFFAPGAGVPEDPVTGSAHCCLGPYWAAKLGKSDLAGFQCSERGGSVRVAVRDSRVLLQGHAVTTLRGEFLA
jgi:PhzF family phenazine biosynthesis protein